jgi:CDP-6-deoxy-D-xylo-4-hexulose-3-dehydrase
MGAEVREIPKPGALHDEREIDAVLEVLRGSALELGPKVAEMERRTAELLAKRRGVMVNSGSSALRLAIDLLHCEPGDEIVTSVLTFSTDVAPMVQSGIVPVLVDVEPDTYQIDVQRIEEMIGPRTRAILAPNLVGNCPDWDAVRAIADRHGLAVVEDACDVLDSWLRDTRTGARSDISVTSFARTHSITAAGNGGMVGIDDEEQFDECLMLRRWGRRSEQYLFGSKHGARDRLSSTVDGLAYDNMFVFETLGYNFEPGEIGAAYGCVQLDKLLDYNARRREAFRRYDEWFRDHEERFSRPRTTADLETTWMLYPFIGREDAGFSRTQAQEFLESRGVPTRVVWSGNITRQPAFAGVPRREAEDGYPHADRVMERALMLPTHQGLSSDDVDYVVEQLEALVDAH